MHIKVDGLRCDEITWYKKQYIPQQCNWIYQIILINSSVRKKNFKSEEKDIHTGDLHLSA